MLGVTLPGLLLSYTTVSYGGGDPNEKVSGDGLPNPTGFPEWGERICDGGGGDMTTGGFPGDWKGGSMGSLAVERKGSGAEEEG